LATLGDILLLLNTYREKADTSTLSVSVPVDPQTHKLLAIVAQKLDSHSDRRITKSRLIRVLLKFSIEALELDKVAACAEPLHYLPEDASPRKRISSLKHVSDVLNVEPGVLTNISTVDKSDIIWRTKEPPHQ